MDVKCPCGVVFQAQRSTARFHSPACRKRASRAPQQEVAPQPATADDRVPAAPAGSDFEVATRRELDRLGQVDTMLGLQVLIVARRMSAGTETGSALATLSKEHSRLMSALGAAEKQADPVDQVGKRREEKRARATAR
ncbi:hypothetical protein [Winogradskya humida]|uniref:Uncharacterized protein n=1 Tax=Winogradskya humida TaxID=113566 RepID=A0ABQ4A793_9ACTN|nr:hypothetical protein [Actinoplanes humidus]GIE26683.1 hypothetical protein Ahu01nite_097850 [Actinoplanes humidus]